ncbi:hypothetical protein QC762_0016830 [Podospora pseudocomata]|uniref:Uncharacterized protein n=1 Tax=Podospora pseudocomata TaxID=2093779 RepID=A0ABR0GWU2_9PEZI|nr:hypothetical protein QC762_0016830 [Podospora pseudocomata]
MPESGRSIPPPLSVSSTLGLNFKAISNYS